MARDMGKRRAARRLPARAGVELLERRVLLDGSVFGSPVSYPVFGGASRLVCADFTVDGSTDIAVAAYGGAPGMAVSILPNNGDGTFGPAVTVPGVVASELCAGDFNGDGRPDLAVEDADGGVITILMNNGDGTFTSASKLNCSGCGQLAASDVNGDGFSDLIVGTRWSTGPRPVEVFLSNGDGTFAPPSFYSVDLAPTLIAVADFNGDGHPDLAVADVESSGVSVVLNNGDGTFGTCVDTPCWSTDTMAPGDLNGDGRDDLVTNFYECGVSSLVSNGDGRLADQGSLGQWWGISSLGVADFRGDGSQDIAVLSYWEGNRIGLYLNNGDGTFTPGPSVSVSNQSSLVVADLNGDGNPDVVTGGTESVDVLLNQLPPLLSPSAVVPLPMDGQNGNVEIGYTLWDANAEPCSVQVDYSTDGGSTWRAATAGNGGDGTDTLASGPKGIRHTFIWDSTADLGNQTYLGVRVRVTPSAGGTGTAGTSPAFRVKDGPNRPPSAAVTLNSHTPRIDGVLTATATEADADGDPVSLTFVWKINGVTVRTYTTSGALTDSLDLQSLVSNVGGDAVSIEVIPNDGMVDGATVTDTAVTVPYQPPTATVSLDSHSPKANAMLTATATKNDPDGGPVSLTFVWQVDGAVVRTFTSDSALSDSLDLAMTVAGTGGQNVTVDVTPNDGRVDGTVVSDSASVAANSLPVATVSLDTHAPTAHGTLTAIATKADADGDAVSLTFVWRINGVVVRTCTSAEALTDTLRLGAVSNRQNGDGIAVEVTPNDGVANGPSASEVAHLVNHPPTASITLSAHQIYCNGYLHATVSGSDPDGDPVILTTTWKINGVVWPYPVSWNFAPWGLHVGDVVSAEVTPSDGILSGDTVTDSAVVVNSPPEVYSNLMKTVLVGQFVPFTRSDFESHFSDPDSDTLRKIKVIALPTHGIVTLWGARVWQGEKISAADLDGLVYTPTPGFDGHDYIWWNGSDGSLWATSPATFDIDTGIEAPDVIMYSPIRQVKPGDTVSVTVQIVTSGELPIAPTGTVTLTDTDGSDLGTVPVVDGQASFSVAGLSIGDHRLSARYSGDWCHQATESGTPLGVRVLAHNVVDVLALYTPSLDSYPDLAATINNAVSDADLALTNSGADLTIELAGIVRTDYIGSGTYQTDLSRLQTVGDGYMDEVPGLRAQYRADLVCLFVSYQQSNGLIGLANVMRSLDPSVSNSQAFSVVYVNTAGAPYYTFAHEIGHNLGAAHDHEQGDGPGLFDDSYGYRFTGSDGVLYHDIMSYDPGRTIPYYANPAVSYAGVPTGKPGYADVVRTLNASAPVVAGYMDGSVLPVDMRTAVTFSLPQQITDQYTFPVTVSGLATVLPRLSGKIVMLDGSAAVGGGDVVDGSASCAVSLPAGLHTLRAVFQGDGYYGDSVSPPVDVHAVIPPHLQNDGTLIIEGTDQNDTVTILSDGVQYSVDIDGLTFPFSVRAVGSVSVDVLGGDDCVNVLALTRPATVDGGSGNDTIIGGAGADSLMGGLGNDAIYGGGGADTILGGAGNDYIFGGAGADSILGGGGADTIIGGTGADTVLGGGGPDLIYGQAGADSLDGGAGDDVIFGGGGADTLVGGKGNDLIYAGGGEDWVYVNDGSVVSFHDTVYTGAGTDHVDHDAADTIVGEYVDLLA